MDLINALPNDKNLHWSKFKAFAVNKINVIVKLKSILGRVENIVGKEEKMLVTIIFSFSYNVFKKASFSRSLKVRIVW